MAVEVALAALTAGAGAAEREEVAQLAVDDEVLVVVDGCPEGGYGRLCEPFGGAVRLVELQQNRGVSGARNAGIAQAKGSHVVFLDADDLLGPGQLDAVRACLTGNNPPDVVMVPAQVIDHAGQPTGTLRRPNLWPDRLEGFLQGSSVSTSQATVRRGALIDAGLFDPFLRYCEDWDLWLRLACRGCTFHELRDVHVCYRLHDTQASGDCAKIAKGWEQVIAHARAYVPDRRPYRKLLREAIWNIRLYRSKNRVYALQDVGGLGSWCLDRLAVPRLRFRGLGASLTRLIKRRTPRDPAAPWSEGARA